MLGLGPCSVLGQVLETPVWWDFAGCSHLLCGDGEAEGLGLGLVPFAPEMPLCTFKPKGKMWRRAFRKSFSPSCISTSSPLLALILIIKLYS